VSRLPRRLLQGLLALECLGIAWLVLSPTAETPIGVVYGVSNHLARLGMPTWARDTGLIEFVLNVLLFIPLAALCALLWTRPKVWVWIVGGLLLSSSLEWLQQEFLSSRSASSLDIIANTIGAAVGAGVVCSTRWLHQVWLEDLPLAGRES
jgi:hypothetical protein